MSNDGSRESIEMDEQGCCYWLSLLPKLTCRDLSRIVRCETLEDDSSTDSRQPAPYYQSCLYRIWENMGLPPRVYQRLMGVVPPWPGDPYQYDLNKKLSSNEDSKLYAATCWDRFDDCYVKIVKVVGRKSRKHASTEVDFLPRLKNKNVMEMLKFFEVGVKQWIITPLMNGTLRDMIKQREQALGRSYMLFSETTMASIIKKVLSGLAYIHNQNIIHRDVNSMNIMLNSKGEVRLANFGNALYITDGDTTTTELTHTIHGPRRWIAPELLDKKPYGRKTDVWAVGVIAVELVLGAGPPDESGPERLEELYISLLKKRSSLSKNEETMELAQVLDFLNWCLIINLNHRLTAIKLMKLPFFAKAKGTRKIKKELLRYPLLRCQSTTHTDIERYEREDHERRLNRAEQRNARRRQPEAHGSMADVRLDFEFMSNDDWRPDPVVIERERRPNQVIAEVYMEPLPQPKDHNKIKVEVGEQYKVTTQVDVQSKPQRKLASGKKVDIEPLPHRGDPPEIEVDIEPLPYRGDPPEIEVDIEPLPHFGDPPEKEVDNEPLPHFGDPPQIEVDIEPLPHFGDPPEIEVDIEPLPHFGDPPQIEVYIAPLPHCGDPPEIEVEIEPLPHRGDHSEIEDDIEPLPHCGDSPETEVDIEPLPYPEDPSEIEVDIEPLPYREDPPEIEVDIEPLPYPEDPPEIEVDIEPLPYREDPPEIEVDIEPLPYREDPPEIEVDIEPLPYPEDPPEIEVDIEPLPYREDPPEIEVDIEPLPYREDPPEIEVGIEPLPYCEDPPEIEVGIEPLPYCEDPPEIEVDIEPLPYRVDLSEIEVDIEPLPYREDLSEIEVDIEPLPYREDPSEIEAAVSITMGAGMTLHLKSHPSLDDITKYE